MSLREWRARLAVFWDICFSRPDFSPGPVDYDAYWNRRRGAAMGGLNSFQLARARWILQRVREGDSLLDLGSGDGAVLMHIAGQKQVRALAADVSPKAVDHLRQCGLEALCLDFCDPAQVENLPQVDHILLLEVLEHLPNPEKLLKQLEKKAKVSIFFSIPNTGYLPFRLRLLLGSFPVQWRNHPGEHLRFWTLRDLRWWLRCMGYAHCTELHLYEGLPGLHRLWPGLFAMAIVGCIRLDGQEQA